MYKLHSLALHRRSQLFSPHVLRWRFGVSVLSATRLCMITTIVPLWRTPSHLFIQHEKIKLSANLQVAHLRVVTKNACAVSKMVAKCMEP